MDGYFFHATGSTVAILKSKKLLGSNKAVAKLGPDYLEKAPDNDLYFMAGKIGDHSINVGLGRIKAPNVDDYRSVLVFSDPNNKIESLMNNGALSRGQSELKGKSGAYYVLRGRNTPLSDIRIGMIIGFKEDMPGVPEGQDQGTAFFMNTVNPHISNLEFFSCSLNEMNDQKLRTYLTEAIAHDCFR